MADVVWFVVVASMLRGVTSFVQSRIRHMMCAA